MTREEILDVVHKTIYQFLNVCENEETMSDKDKLLLKVNKAICNNIKALKQEPGEDCVSRQAVLNLLNLFNKTNYYSWEKCLLKRKIKELPSVTPTRKKGRWIKTGQSFIDPNKFLCYSCSECGFDVGKVKTRFCPGCGLEMKCE